MTRLSVNLNKVALIRNSRGENLPDLVQIAKDCEAFGAQGITLHPRPDERHARYSDIPKIKKIVTTEFNIEGNPNPKFLDLVLSNPPHQCTLVPDPPGILTSNEGWDTIKHKAFLIDIIQKLKSNGIRVSIFLNPDIRMVEGAKEVGTDRIEFYTGHYAKNYSIDPEKAVKSHAEAAKRAMELGIGINAGHDLNLDNLAFYKERVEGLLEVSIGHALISDALYYGLENTIKMYLSKLQ